MRDVVLGRVRTALARVARPELSPAAPPTAAADPAALRTAFASAAAAVGTVVHAVPDGDAAAAALATLLAALPERRVVAWDAPAVAAVARTAAARTPDVTLTILDTDADPVAAGAADVGVTGVDALVATSGTLVLGAAGPRHRAASLLPPLHVALAPASYLVPDLATALAGLGPDAAGRCTTLITGPSRTADIEKKLVMGVHGPCALHVLLVG